MSDCNIFNLSEWKSPSLPLQQCDGTISQNLDQKNQNKDKPENVFAFDILLFWVITGISMSSVAVSAIDPLVFAMGCQQNVITLSLDQ